MLILYLILSIFLAVILIIFSKKKNILLSFSGNAHQKFTSVINVPLIGGLIILFFFLLISEKYFIYNFLVVIIFLIGFLSDTNKINSPLLRLLLQIISVTIFLYCSNIFLVNTKVPFLDLLLKNYFFSICFTTFCILIIMNGTNFMDGINGFVLTYYLIVSVVLLNLGATELFFFNYNNLKFIIILIILLYFLNIFNFLYLGDSGAYLLGFIFSVELIFFYNIHENISPFFIILLLWYPAFESLFSILRKFNLKKSPMLPDTNHLHQLIYYYFIKKIKLNSIFFNNLTALAINFYNAIIIYLSFLKISNNQFQLFLIFLNILFYIFFYIRLIKIKN